MAAKPFAVNHDLSSADVNDLTGVYIRRTNEVDVVSTVVETDLLKSGGGTALSIAASAMSTDRMVRATILGDYLNNTGGGFTFRVKLGGTTLIADGSLNFPASATRRPVRIVVEVANLASASVQWVSADINIGRVGATTGIGDLNGIVTDALDEHLAGSGTVNTGVACDFLVTIENTASSASLSFRKKYASVELL